MIWDYVIAVNGNRFCDNFLCSLFLLLCFLMKVAIRGCVIAVNGDGFGSFALYIFYCVF